MTVDRRAARLVVVDPAGRVLLFLHAPREPHRPQPFWSTPGGGLEPGESFEQAARREAREELGLDGVALEPLSERVADLTWCVPPIRQHERYFVLRHPPMTFDAAVEASHRLERIVEARWFSAEDLDTCGRPVHPETLAAWLRGLSPPAAGGA